MNIKPVSFGCDCCQKQRPVFVKVSEGMYVNPQNVFAIKPGIKGVPEIISNAGASITPPKETYDHKGMDLEEYPSCEQIKKRLEVKA